MGEWLVSAAIGFVSGVLSGAFGIGGGIVTTPGIRLLAGAAPLIAVGTPLPVIIPSALTGALSYHRQGLTDLRSAVILGLAGSPLAIAGALLATRVGGTTVLLGTALLIFYAAADTILQVLQAPTDRTRRHHDGGDEGEPGTRPQAGEGEARSKRAKPVHEGLRLHPHTPVPVPALITIGIVTGVYSGFFGLGGGFVLVPMLTRWLHFPIKRAIGTSLVTVSMLAVPGTIAHALLGNIDWGIALGLAVGVIPGALLGARLTLGARDRHVRIGFAILLLVTGVWLAVTELGALLR